MTATATRQTKRQDKTWQANIGQAVGGVAALRLTATAGSRVEHFGYYVQAIPADFGLAYYLEKFSGQVEDGEPASYHVNLDLGHGEHQCECKGQLRWGHRRPCKHIRALLALHTQGKLPRID
jgi:hypothetical protein